MYLDHFCGSCRLPAGSVTSVEGCDGSDDGGALKDRRWKSQRDDVQELATIDEALSAAADEDLQVVLV